MVLTDLWHIGMHTNIFAFCAYVYLLALSIENTQKKWHLSSEKHTRAQILVSNAILQQKEQGSLRNGLPGHKQQDHAEARLVPESKEELRQQRHVRRTEKPKV
jgi:hypothetical protein